MVEHSSPFNAALDALGLPPWAILSRDLWRARGILLLLIFLLGPPYVVYTLLEAKGAKELSNFELKEPNRFDRPGQFAGGTLYEPPKKKVGFGASNLAGSDSGASPLLVSGDDACAGVVVGRPKLDDPFFTVPLGPRLGGAVLVIDFFLLTSQHELPQLNLRLEEMGPHIDAFFIVEGNRELDLEEKDGFAFEALRQRSASIQKWLHKIQFWPVTLRPRGPEGRPASDVRAEIMNGFRRQVALAFEGQDAVMIEGNVDEIVARPVLAALRSCQPTDGLPWNTKISMKDYSFDLTYYSAEYWDYPPNVASVEEILAEETAGGLDSPGGGRGRGLVRLRSGRPAGWHFGWMLDGAEGLAHHVLHGNLEARTSWQPHMDSPASLAEFFRSSVLADPVAHFDGTLSRATIHVEDLPEEARRDPAAYGWLFGKHLERFVREAAGGAPASSEVPAPGRGRV